MLVKPFNILRHIIKSAFKGHNSNDSKRSTDTRSLYVKPSKHSLCWNWMMKAKSLKTPLMIKEICFCLPPGLDGRNVCSQKLFT